MSRRQTAVWRRLALVLGGLWAACAAAQTPYDVTETWSAGGLAGWTGGGGQVALTNDDGYLAMDFAQQGHPRPVYCVARRALPGGLVVSNLAFRFLAAEILPSSLRLCISGADIEQWYAVVPVSSSGAWLDCNVALDFSAGWSVGPRSTAAAFENARDRIAAVGIYVLRDASARAQRFGIDDFRIRGAQYPIALAIAGTVSYGGELAGAVRVEAASVGGAGDTNVTAVLPGPGSYRLAGLPGNTDYRVTAYLDADADGLRDFWEPAAAWSGNPVKLTSADADGVDLPLADPTSADGLPYWWLKKHFDIEDPAVGGEPALAGVDSDHDGMINYAEYRAGTEPTNRLSRLEVEILQTGEAGGVALRWSSVAHRSYSVLTNSDLRAPFAVHVSSVTAHPPRNAYEDGSAAGAASRFYRIRVD